MDPGNTQPVIVCRGVLNKNKHRKKKGSISQFHKLCRDEPWYKTFEANWNNIEQQLQDIHQNTYNSLLEDLVSYIKNVYNNEENDFLETVIPSATLLTGINQPDHGTQFTAFIKLLREEATPHIAMVHSQDVSTIKQLVETVVWQLINGHEVDETLNDEDMDIEASFSKSKSKMKKSQCTLSMLECWYKSTYVERDEDSDVDVDERERDRRKPLVIIIPDFESFNYSILQDLVLILSSHTTTLRLVLVFGVATSVSAIHKTFPFHVSSKLLIKVFQTQPSPVHMNRILEDIFLSPSCPFQLSGKTLDFLTDVFLFYDFSITRFIQGFKYCMMEHLYDNNAKALCCSRDSLSETLSSLTPKDLENIRKFHSFRPYVESQKSKDIVSLFHDDDYFRKSLMICVNDYYDYVSCFYAGIRMLLVFIKDFPKNSLGTNIREIYSVCTTEPITQKPAFNDCMHLLNLQSQQNLIEKTKNAIKILNYNLKISSPIKPFSPRNSPKKAKVTFHRNWSSFFKECRVVLLTFVRELERASQDCTFVSNEKKNKIEDKLPMNRYQLKQNLLSATISDKVQSEFEMIRTRLVDYLTQMFANCLQQPTLQTFHEIFVFDDLLSVKKQLVGSSRGAVHLALTNPNAYLQCVQVCPDVCLSYGVLRECGTLVNLHDWLVAFCSILRPDLETPDRDIQVRFNRAVAELQFLGFIKPSKRKTDHVMRLTW